MFRVNLDHVKCVESYMIMACNVYALVYYKITTIAICDMQLEDINVQGMLWRKFKEVILKHDGIKPNFKGFMPKNAKANWNEVKIINGIKDPTVKMVDKEHTCLFH